MTAFHVHDHSIQRDGSDFLFQVSEATPDDLAQLTQVHRFGRITSDSDITPRYAWARFTNDEYYHTWAENLFDGTKRVLKAVLNDTVIGLAVLGQADRGDGYDEIWTKHPRLCELHQMYIVSGYQGSGLGKVLFRTITKAAVALDHDAMVINLLSNNTQARKFYEKMGAELVSTIRETKTGEPNQSSIEISCELMLLAL